jgi:hypothetical protein
MVHSCHAAMLQAHPPKGKFVVSFHFPSCLHCQINLCSLAHLHRQADGKLKQGVLRKWTHHCTEKFNIYVPHDLVACPRIVVLCSNPHSHPPPAPVKTPTPLVDIFHELLALMKWKLVDATPRRIYFDTAFIQGLHEVLGWDFPDGRDATLQDLHPSLANLDHVRRLINILRSVKYPCGTGFEGRYYY